MRKVLDRTGKRFGQLIAVAEAGRDKQGRALWLCRCDCGSEKVIPSRHLGSGAIQSCGCIRSAQAAANGQQGADKISGSRSPLWKQTVSYSAAHQRVRTERGSAAGHPCVDCDERAHHWSYDLTDKDEMVENGLRYSLDVARYVARCVRCHSQHDREQQ